MLALFNSPYILLVTTAPSTRGDLNLMVFPQSQPPSIDPPPYSTDVRRPRTDSEGDVRDSRTKRVFDALKRSRSVSAAPPDKRSIPKQDPQPPMAPPLANMDTPIARHRSALNPGSIAENLEDNGPGWVGGILHRRSDPFPPGSTPGATPNFQKPRPPSNSPYLFHPIPAEVSEDESDPESDPESAHSISDSPPRLPHFLTPGGNYMSTFIRDFKLDATIGSPPKRPPSPTRSRTSSVLTERPTTQEQDSQRSTSLPPVSHGGTLDRTETGGRKESPPGRNKSPQEVWNSMEGD